MYLLLVSFVVKRIYIIIYLRNILLFNDLSVTANRKKHLMNTCFLKYLKNISSPSDFEKHLMNICFLKYLKNISSPSDFEKHLMNICFLKYLKNI